MKIYDDESILSCHREQSLCINVSDKKNEQSKGTQNII